VWVTNELDGSVSRIDPASNEATEVPVTGRPTALASGRGDVYVALRPIGAAHRGGTLRVLEGDVFFTVDPAVAYSTELWRVLTLTNDTLLTYRRVAGQAGFQLVPDLARALPVVSEDGTSYTFELRPGIRYSTGDVVKASDVRSSIERAFALRPHRQDAIADFFGRIRGAHTCKPGRCNLSRGIVADDSARTVTFHLSAADPIFLNKLALPFASVLPSSTSRSSEAVRRPLPATGPYRIASVVPKRTVRLVRNPRFEEWSSAAQPAGFPDEIVIDFGVSQKRRTAALAAGKANLTPLAPFEPLPASPALLPNVRRHPLAFTVYFFFNPSAPPFDDVRARQAVNYAIDRDRIVQLSGDEAVSTCQALPPNFPGYRRYCPYTLDANREGTWTAPDLAKARRLVRASGTSGAEVTIWFPPDADSVGRYVAEVIESLGYRIHLKTFKDGGAYFETMIAGSPQIALSAWAPDYPTADNFIQVLFSCGSFSNFGSFCDRKLDRRIEHALEVQQRDPALANRLWAALDHELVDKAAWLALYNTYGADLISETAGNYQYNPQYGALLSQMWVR
jgi:peptide/nickel transport system substrate-binding protein